MNELAEKRYHELFSSPKIKAAAFDRIAQEYYYRNFGSLSKTDLELILFSEYLDLIRSDPNATENDYNDYTLSKLLGITQSRIRGLKERKEIKYPSEFKWEEKFQEVLGKADYKDEKVILYVRDERLFWELKNIIEEMGSYTETTLTRNLIKVSPPVFLDLMEKASDQDDKERMRAKLQDILEKNKIDPSFYLEKNKSFRELLQEVSEDAGKNVVLGLLEQIPLVGSALSKSAEPLIDKMLSSINKQKDKSEK